jgi:flagellar FliL protein
MAKPEEDSDQDGEEAAEAQAPKGFKRFLTKKILMIAAPALLLALVGGGAGAYFLFSGSGDAASAAKAENAPITPPKVAFSDMQDILVNIQSADGAPAYLKLSVSLELNNAEEKAAIQPLMPRITDQFQAYLRELRLSDLKGSAGVLRLKEELLRRVNVAAAPYHVRDVLLKQMLVQ